MSACRHSRSNQFLDGESLSSLSGPKPCLPSPCERATGSAAKAVASLRTPKSRHADILEMERFLVPPNL